jgi:serine/threonine-protein kinase
LPAEEAVALIRKIADGLAFCHDHDVVHRDLKPENILVTPAGQPIIMDFGLALTKGAQRVTYANLSATAGTPEYMAPEQVEGKRGDARTDLYALGAILYEMLAGQPPFHGDNPLAVMAQHVQGAVPRLDRERPDVPRPLAAVVARALQRSPDDRYPDLRAFMADLDHLDQVDTSILDQSSAAGAAAAAAPWWQSPTARAVGIGLALVAVLVILGLAAQLLRGPVP